VGILQNAAKKMDGSMGGTNRPKLLRHGAAKTALRCTGMDSMPCLQGTRSKKDQNFLQTPFWHSPSNFLSGRHIGARISCVHRVPGTGRHPWKKSFGPATKCDSV